MVLDNRFQATLCTVSRTSLFKQILFEFECRAENFLLSVQFEEECSQHASLSDGCDLTPPTRTQTSHREHNDLRSSNRRPSTLLPQHFQSVSRWTRSCAFSRYMGRRS